MKGEKRDDWEKTKAMETVVSDYRASGWSRADRKRMPGAGIRQWG